MASSVTETHVCQTDDRIIILDCVCAADGSFTDYALTTKFNGALDCIVTVPTATTLDANWTLTLKDANEVDVLLGRCADMSAAVSQQIAIDKSTFPRRHITTDDTLTLGIADNTTESAAVQICLYYKADE